MNGKLKRKQWHKENKAFVFNHFNGVCQSCHQTINIIDKCDIHHLSYSYKGKLYETTAQELIQNKIITLLCRPCHDRVHTAEDSNNPTHLENKTNCEVCGKVEKGIFDRKRNQKLDKLLCKNCFDALRIKSIDTHERCEICGRHEIGMTTRKNNGKTDRLLCQRCFENLKYGVTQTTLL